MRKRLGTALAAAGLLLGAWGTAPATAAEPCTIDTAGGTLACTGDVAGLVLDCGIRRTEEPPFVTQTVGCGLGPLGAGCVNVSYPAEVGPPDGGDCVVVAGPLVCRVHLSESGAIESGPGCEVTRSARRRASRARKTHRKSRRTSRVG